MQDDPLDETREQVEQADRIRSYLEPAAVACALIAIIALVILVVVIIVVAILTVWSFRP